ncbi:MAG: hypothetical protein HY072_09545 [Deltaproteobacteria bacterium]|nr:hypothetical protein [Deltaproteobacteria bacterium]
MPSPFIPFEWGKTLDSPLVGKRPVPTFAEESGEVTDAALITSPNALDDLVSLIDSAREHLELEFMSLPSTWLKSSGTRIQSPIVSALIAAAKRGVEVKVLLNNEWVFSPKQPPNAPPKPNMVTAQLLQAYAKCYNFPIAAKIVDEKALGITYIHNKGMLIDSEKAFINSINGTQNSVVANREVGVVLESPDAANYYEKAFQIDWEKSASIKPSSGCP